MMISGNGASINLYNYIYFTFLVFNFF